MVHFLLLSLAGSPKMWKCCKISESMCVKKVNLISGVIGKAEK